MTCKNCGRTIADGATMCSYCGTSTGYTPVQQTVNYQAAPTVAPKTVLILGILALALAFEPFTGIASIILGILAMTKANQFNMESAEPSKMVRIGRNLGLAGLICGIIFTIIWTFDFVIIGMVVSELL